MLETYTPPARRGPPPQGGGMGTWSAPKPSLTPLPGRQEREICSRRAPLGTLRSLAAGLGLHRRPMVSICDQ
eukprot:1188322-Prorocentrum_minimum.AAC.3